MAANCEFGDVNRELKTQVLQSCTSLQLRRKAIRDEMDLGKLLEFARSLEVADMQAKVMEAEREGKVNFVGKREKKSQHKGSRKGEKTQTRSDSCGWCGGSRHPKEDCPAKDRKFNSCGRIGHYQKVCRSKKNHNKAKVMQVEVKDESTENSEDEYVFGVGCQRATPQVEVKVNGQTMLCFVDTGASVNVIDNKTYKTLFKSDSGIELEKTSVKMYAYNSNTALPVLVYSMQKQSTKIQ